MVVVSRLTMIILAFVAGMLFSSLYIEATGAKPFFEAPKRFGLAGKETLLKTPKDRVSEKQILVYKDKVVLDLKNAEWSTFTPTKSMVPVLDKGANAIQVKPKPGCADVGVGDIVSYTSEYAEGTIIHRVIATGKDSEGRYFVVKGDNNPEPDPGVVRCEQIKRVLVAIIY